MSWYQRYRVAHYLSTSAWIFPVFGMLAAIVSAHSLQLIDDYLGWKSSVNADTARAALSLLASAMFTFVVFVASALLVAVQLASSQLTPRIIGVVFSDTVTRLSLSVFVFTFVFTLSALLRIGTSVPLLTAYVAAYGCAANLGLFLYLIDHVGKILRPSGALRIVASHGLRVIDDVYPRLITQTDHAASDTSPISNSRLTHTVASATGGTVLAFDLKGLLALAQLGDHVIELVPQVGDYIAKGDTLFRVSTGDTGIQERTLRQSVAIGQERTLEQDPTFAFRVMVDVACKGLSPAINDPTTAVLAIDQIHHLLHAIGQRQLDNGQVRDNSGRLRLAYRTPDWEDFVQLSVTEIRQFGSQSIQINRRLRAMLEDLIKILPPTRASLLRDELAILDRSARRVFTEPEDRAMAEVGDSQGMGGAQAEP